MDQTHHILIVSATETDRERLIASVSEVDAKTTAVKTGSDAIDVLLEENISLVLTTLYTGELDAWRLIRVVRSGSSRRGSLLPVILIADKFHGELAESVCKDYHINQIVSPTKLNALPALIDKCLTIPNYGLQKKRILVIEDHQHTSLLVEKLLGYKYDVEAASDGESGLDAWKMRNHDIVLLDVMLPGISGACVLSSIKQKNPNQIVIMMTASGGMAMAKTFMLEGATDFISKPFEAEYLRQVCDLSLRREELLASVRLRPQPFG